jgi:two-component system nitrate/nitrite response regulator NarL
MILDLGLPGHDGLWVLGQMHALDVGTRVLALSGDDSAKTVCRALATGAAGYLVKDVDGDSLCAGILAIARGEDVLPRRLQGAVTAELRRLANAPVSPLTARELDTLCLAADGCSTAEMARRLHLSTATVKTHLAHVYRKLGVSDRTAAVAEGARRGLIDLSADRESGQDTAVPVEALR